MASGLEEDHGFAHAGGLRRGDDSTAGASKHADIRFEGGGSERKPTEGTEGYGEEQEAGFHRIFREVRRRVSPMMKQLTASRRTHQSGSLAWRSMEK